MAAVNGTVASAVVVPAEQASPPTASSKRRQSSTDETFDGKRPRLSPNRESEQQHRQHSLLDHETPTIGTDDPPPGPPATSIRQRKSFGGKDEERKRGQRLFGAVLGTLSQSSSATPQQRRRVDIERKQQAKRELQIQEEGEMKRKALEEIFAGRRREQKVWDAESMRIRHANELAVAGLLRTKAEPRLYYKPWKLRPQEKARIEIQIQEAQAKVDRELADLSENQIQQESNGGRRETSYEVAQLDGSPNVLETEPPPMQVSERVGTNGSTLAVSTSSLLDDTNATNVPVVEPLDALPVSANGKGEKENENENTREDKSEHATPDVEDAGKENVEDMEEVMVEAGEDPVIY